MKNANSTEVSRVKIPKLNYASTKKPLWLKGQSDMGSTPIILPPLPPKMDTPRNSTRMSGQHRASFHQASGYLSDQQQKRRGDSKHLTPRSNRKTGLEFNVIKEMDVTHSIRNKIEQYRKWHDAHHKEPQTPRRKMTVAATQGTRQGENELTARRGRKPEVGDLLTGKPDVVMQMPQTGNSRAKRPVRGKSTDICAKSLQGKNILMMTSVNIAPRSIRPSLLSTQVLDVHKHLVLRCFNLNT
ncbi:hypothetical protein CAPTEDRAFT_201354 [Capitella teleta]|uniref:Uncharacterized protein n=1 Tax=Capitella teleta TaxID=283909 RepID=R7V134_CAPTE|nr:hypothetical protein CAPTEDRAFT_201354 [Capitella teleta]|eukprot:ELU12229.1 hypothetical protein CAPTEDRAFT_201354 [Capitella teleta]